MNHEVQTMNNGEAVKSNGNKIIVWIVKLGLLIVPVLPLVVTRSLFFPFITGRNFIFRIIIGIIFVFWLWLMMKDPSYRPKSSPILYAVVAFIVVLFLATIFGIWPYRSFWSNFERMEGFWGHWHYFLYFLMLASVFKTEADWKRFFGVSLGASAAVSIYALLQLLGKLDVHQGDERLDATMGNATYLAMYLVFHIFLLLYFFLKTRNVWWRLAFMLAGLFELFIVYRTATRGAMVGLLGGLLVVALVSALWSRGRARRIGLAVLAAVIAAPIIFWLVKDASFVRNSDVLVRFASISLKEGTTQSRFIIWNMAYQAWKERPVLGWGPESFVYIFSKYYDGRMWRQEPWFDRAHNAFFDWLAAAGAAGLLVYLGLFGSSVWVLIKLLKRKHLEPKVAGVMAGLLAAYFINNIFVFDNFTSYMLFFAVLAALHRHFVEWRHGAGRSIESLERVPNPTRAIISGAVGLMVVFSLYFFNVKPILAAGTILESLRLLTYSRDGGQVRDLSRGVEALKRGIELDTFGTGEIREQLAMYSEKVNQDPLTPSDQKAALTKFALEQMKMQKEASPYDIRARAFLATLYGTAGDYASAVTTAKEGLAVSYQRQQFYFILAEAYFKAGEEVLALETARQAYELAPEYPDAIHNYAILAIYAGHPKTAQDLLKKHFGSEVIGDAKYVNAYAALGDFGRVVLIWEKLVEASPANAAYRFNLASVYVKVFQDKKAIEQLEKAIELSPQFKDQGEAFIKQIKEGKIKR